MNAFDLHTLLSNNDTIDILARLPIQVTRDICDNGIIKKKTNQKEIDVLKKLQSCERTPFYLMTSGNKVYMTKMGTSLRDLIGSRRVNEGKRVVREYYDQLQKDLYSALECMHSKGIKHLYLERGAAIRNITWDGNHFNVIDFDKVEYIDYDWVEQANSILDWLKQWSS